MKIDQELIEQLRDLAKRCNDRLAAAELESLCDFHASRLQSLKEENERLREQVHNLEDYIDTIHGRPRRNRTALSTTDAK